MGRHHETEMYYVWVNRNEENLIFFSIFYLFKYHDID